MTAEEGMNNVDGIEELTNMITKFEDMYKEQKEKLELSIQQPEFFGNPVERTFALTGAAAQSFITLTLLKRVKEREVNKNATE